MSLDSVSAHGSVPLARSRLRRAAPVAAGEGRGAANAHHGEILQGVFEMSDGRLQRGLVTLGVSAYWSQAAFTLSARAPVLVEPAWKVKARRAAELALAATGMASAGGQLRLESNVPPGWGLGSSTCDVTAAIRAVAAACGREFAAATIARLAVEAEVASDSTMFGDRAVLFAQRRGIVLDELGGPLPALEILGFNTDPSGCGIATLALPPARYSWWEIEAFRPLRGLVREAVRSRDARHCAQVATASARINQRHLPKPHFDRLERLAEDVGACGLQVAHSGTVAGLLFDPADSLLHERIRVARRRLRELSFGSIRRCRAGVSAAEAPC